MLQSFVLVFIRILTVLIDVSGVHHCCGYLPNKSCDGELRFAEDPTQLFL
jgi:hypothetical protein